MQPSELKQQLGRNDFVLLHGIMPEGGGLDKVKRCVLVRFLYCLKNRNTKIFDTFIFKNGAPNMMWGGFGLVVDKAELLRFRRGDGGRTSEMSADDIRESIPTAEISNYLSLYNTNPTPPDYCEISIHQVSWSAIWIDRNNCNLWRYWRLIEEFAVARNLPVMHIGNNWELVH